MEPRVKYQKYPDAIAPLMQLEAYLHSEKSTIEASLFELVKMRASQINGCAFCMDMHSKDARAAGETEQRLYLLSAWREAPMYSSRERAALEWTEAVTTLSPLGVSDEMYERVRGELSEKELVDLNMAVIAINAWNRLGVPFRSVPGHYTPNPT